MRIENPPAMFWTIACAFAALVFHLWFDLHKQKQNHPIVHWISAAIVLSISLFFGIGDEIFSHRAHKWEQFAILSLLIHLSLFDPIWNWLHREEWNYHGSADNPKQAWTDKIWTEVHPLGELFFRAVFLILGFCVWFSWDRIIQGGWLGYE